MNAGNWIAISAITAPIVGSIVWLIYRVGHTVNRIEQIEKDMPPLKNKISLLDRMSEALADIKDKVKQIPKLAEDVAKLTGLWEGTLAASHSPRQLTPLGKSILEKSGIGKIVDERFSQILDEVREAAPENAYRAEQDIITVVGKFREDNALLSALENGAFQSGSDVDSVLLVGAIYIRDRVLEALGIEPEIIAPPSQT